MPYDPPENVEELLKDCLEKLDPASQLHGSWLDFPLNDHVFKFKVRLHIDFINDN